MSAILYDLITHVLITLIFRGATIGRAEIYNEEEEQDGEQDEIEEINEYEYATRKSTLWAYIQFYCVECMVLITVTGFQLQYKHCLFL